MVKFVKGQRKKRREGIAEKRKVGRQGKERQGRHCKGKKVEMNRMWAQDQATCLTGERAI